MFSIGRKISEAAAPTPFGDGLAAPVTPAARRSGLSAVPAERAARPSRTSRP